MPKKKPATQDVKTTTTESTPTATPPVAKVESLVVVLRRERKLLDLIRLVRGKGVIGDIRKILDGFDLAVLPGLIDLISTIINNGKPTTRTEVTEAFDNIIALIRLAAESTNTTVDDEFAAIVEEIIGGGTLRAFLERLFANAFDVHIQKKQLGIQNIDTMAFSWFAIFQLAKFLFDLASSMWGEIKEDWDDPQAKTV